MNGTVNNENNVENKKFYDKRFVMASILTETGKILAEVPVDSKCWSFFKKTGRNWKQVIDHIKSSDDSMIIDEIILNPEFRPGGLLMHFYFTSEHAFLQGILH